MHFYPVHVQKMQFHLKFFPAKMQIVPREMRAPFQIKTRALVVMKRSRSASSSASGPPVYAVYYRCVKCLRDFDRLARVKQHQTQTSSVGGLLYRPVQDCHGGGINKITTLSPTQKSACTRTMVRQSPHNQSATATRMQCATIAPSL